jgi:hypothetical protein
VIAARRLARPISTFARAAERFGVDSTAAPIAEGGSRELRTAIRAFNRMQERLKRYVDDRTQMLAAMSHDLRTPLNRLRLRAELIEDGEQQHKIFADLDAMDLMIDQTLAFARDDAQREPRRLVDLGVLVEDICEDAADAGALVSYAGPRGVNVCCRPTALSRAVANLVDNAVKYAGAANVRILRGPDRVVISVEDHGPGIPPDECEKVFAPFYRLDRSRNSATGGVGLGLSVTRTMSRSPRVVEIMAFARAWSCQRSRMMRQAKKRGKTVPRGPIALTLLLTQCRPSPPEQNCAKVRPRIKAGVGMTTESELAVVRCAYAKLIIDGLYCRYAGQGGFCHSSP